MTRMSGGRFSIDWRAVPMTPEAIATLIASFGAIIAALFGIYRASGGSGKAEARPSQNDLPNLVTRYLDLISEIDRKLSSAVNLLQDIRRALEGTAHRQERMVEELEAMERSMTRIENAQGAASQLLAANKHLEETKVSVLGQIRDDLKNLRNAEYSPHLKP